MTVFAICFDHLAETVSALLMHAQLAQLLIVYNIYFIVENDRVSLFTVLCMRLLDHTVTFLSHIKLKTLTYFTFYRSHT